MWLWTGIAASIFCLLASAGLAITSLNDAGPGVVVFALLALFWAKMLFTMLRQTRNPEAHSVRETEQGAESQSDSEYEPGPVPEARPESDQTGVYAKPVARQTVFVAHWFLMGAIMLTALLICLAIIVPLLVK